jgi:phage gp46-like protein
MLTPETVERAKEELRTKSLAQIHYETAMVWLARAVAAHQISLQTHQPRYLIDAEDYAHEALEHGALSEEGGATVLYIETILLPLRQSLGRR